MTGLTGSLDLTLAEVRAERVAHTVHADAVDTKAGVVLGFAGAVAALGSQHVTVFSVLGVAAAVLAALLALIVILQHRFPAWQLSDWSRLRQRWFWSRAVRSSIEEGFT